MGTVAGLRTRRYHGLLVVAVDGPAARMLGLVALDPVLVVGDARLRLATDEWGDGTVDPRGHELLARFAIDRGVPRWRWQVGDVVVERELAMAHGRAAVGVVHRLVRADRPVRLELTPLCTWRSVHGERFADGTPSVEPTADGFVFEGAYRVAGPGWAPGGDWYRGRAVAGRGRPRAERPGGRVGRGHLQCSTRARADPGGHRGRRTLRGRAPPCQRPRAGSEGRARTDSRAAPGRRTPSTGSWSWRPTSSSSRAPAGPAVVAGYPWFGEWSRDAMTSYEGLFLSTNRWDEGREALRRAAATVSEGMLANTADTGTLEYNTADGTLWFVHAVGRHVAVTRRRRPRRRARARPSGGSWRATSRARATASGSIQPTVCCDRAPRVGRSPGWMRGSTAGRSRLEPARPWRSTRCGSRRWRWRDRLLAKTPSGERCAALRAQATRSFRSRFVRSDGAGLLDVVDGPTGDDRSLRPNQLLAVSLPHAPLASARGGRRRTRGRRRVPPVAAHAVGPPVALPRRPAIPGTPSRLSARARRSLPPRHGVAVAPGPLRRRRRAGRGAPRRHPRRDRGPSRRMGARIGLGDRRRYGPAQRDGLSVPGLVRGRDPAGATSLAGPRGHD